MNQADIRKREIADGERRPLRTIDDAKRAAIVKSYQEGLSQDQVARKYGVSQTSVRRILKEEHIQSRLPVRPKRFLS